MADLVAPTHIILHCSDTVDDGGINWRAIRRYHIEHNGWSDIGYHFGIERWGDHHVLLPGRSPRIRGAHCRAGGRNRDSLGLCVVGRFDERAPDEPLYRVVVSTLAWLCLTHDIHPGNVEGHSEWESAKTCPGTQWDMLDVRKDIYAALRGGNQPHIKLGVPT